MRFLRRRYWDDERARELEVHLAQEIDDNLARGMTRDAARSAAYRKLGNPTLIREEIYAMNSLGFLESLWQDLRYGARVLRRNPTFAVVAILTLALGTGANTAVFQLVDAVRMRALPVRDADRLVEVGIDTHGKGRTGNFISRRPVITEPVWRALLDRQQAFSSMLAWGTVSLDLSSGGESRPAQGIWVSGDFFTTLGLGPEAGRLFTSADDQKGCGSPGAVISDAFWRRQFGADPQAIGRPVSLDGRPFEVVGVTPRGFFGVEVGKSFDVALPLCAEPIIRGEQTALGKPDVWFLDAIARLKPGWTVEKASAQLAALSPAILQATLPPKFNAEDSRDYLAFTFNTKEAATGVSLLRSSYATPLWVLLGVTGAVLLIACANLANLMLARATAREREVAVRLAIGASRRRLVRQMLSESLLIAACGAVAGFALARWLSPTLVAFLNTEGNQIFVDLQTDWRVFAFTAALAIAACLLFGLAPALRATGAALSTTMKAGSRGLSDSGERFNLRRLLVVVQVAVSLILVVGALLLTRTFQNLLRLDPGFTPDGVVVASLDLRPSHATPQERPLLCAQILERLRALPGVDAVAQAYLTPISGNGWNNRILLAGRVQPGVVNFNSVGDGYFQALGTPILEGRDFSRLDTVRSEPVALINESLARKYFAGSTPIGRAFQIEVGQGEPQRLYRIIGVVKDTKYTDLRESFTPIAYVAQAQEQELPPFPQYVLRSRLPLAGVSAAATRALTAVNPAILVQYQTMRAEIRESLVSERLMATLSGFFGGLAVLIATIGLYGVMSYMVTRRRIEIGIRMALGADRGSVVRLVVREAGVLLGGGLLVGSVLAIVAARAAESLLYGLRPWDPLTLALAASTLGVVSLVAAWLPALRASRVHPTVALREE